MNSVCPSLLPPSNRRRCVKKPAYSETSDVLGEIVNDDSNYSFNTSDYDYINGENAEDGDEEQVTIDLSDFLSENPLLAEQAAENAPETVDGIDSNSQFRVTSSQVDFNATSDETPLSSNIESEEKSEVDVLSNSVSNCIIADKTTISDIVDSQLTNEASIKDEISSKENILSKKNSIANKSFIKAKLTKSLSNPLRKYKNFIKTKELNKISQVDTNGLGKYPVVKCEKLNIENLVKENKIKIGNWPLNLINSRNKAKILVTKNCLSSKKVSIPKFAVKSTRIFKRPISINKKYATKTKNGSPFNKMNSILVDSFDARTKSIVINTDVWKSKVGNIYSNSLNNFRLPPTQEKIPSNTNLDPHVKIIGSQVENSVYSIKGKDVQKKITVISAVNKKIEKPKLFQLIAPKQSTKTNLNCVSPKSPKPIIETAVTPPPVNDYTVIEPYVEDPTSPVKPKPILTVPIEIVPTPEPLKQILSFNVGSKDSPIKPLKKSPTFLNGRPKKLQNSCAKLKGKSLTKNLELNIKTPSPTKSTTPNKSTLIISNAKDVVVNAMESVFSSNQNPKKVVKPKRTIKKIIETPIISPLVNSNVCKAYNNTLNDILFSCDDDAFTDLESSFTSIEEFSPVYSEFNSENIENSKANYGQVKPITDVQNQENSSVQNDVQIHHKHMKKVKYKKKKPKLPCGSDTLSASEGEIESKAKEINLAKRNRKSSYTKTIENVVKSSSPSQTINSNMNISLTELPTEKTRSPSIDEKTVNLSSLKALDTSSDSNIDVTENTKPLGLRSRRLSGIPKSSDQVSEMSSRKTRRKVDVNDKSKIRESPSKLTQDVKPDNDAGNFSLKKVTNKEGKYFRFMSQNGRKQVKAQVKPIRNIVRNKVSVRNKSKPQDIIQEIKTITAGSNVSRTRNKKKAVSLNNKSIDSAEADENDFSDSESDSSTNVLKKDCSPRSNSKMKKTLKVSFKSNKRKSVSSSLKKSTNDMNLKLSDANSSSSLSENNENLNSTFRKGKGETMDTSSSEPMKNEIDALVDESNLVDPEIEKKDSIENSNHSNECRDPTADSTATRAKSDVTLAGDTELDEICSETLLPNSMHDDLTADNENSHNISDTDEKDVSLHLNKTNNELKSERENLSPVNCDNENADIQISDTRDVQNISGVNQIQHPLCTLEITDIDTASVIEKSEASCIDNDKYSNSASMISKTELTKSEITPVNHSDVSEGSYDDVSDTSLNILYKSPESELNNEHVQLEKVEKSLVEDKILDLESNSENKSDVENESELNLEKIPATIENASDKQLCVELDTEKVLDTLLENASSIHRISESSLTESKDTKPTRAENILNTEPCIDLEIPSSLSKSTVEESASEIHSCIKSGTADVSELDNTENISETGKRSESEPCPHLESLVISKVEPTVNEDTSDSIDVTGLEEDSDLKNTASQIVVKTEVDDATIQPEFGSKPEVKRLRRKKCPKLKISVAKDAKSSTGSKNTRNWYVSQRKESTDSVMSDISDLGTAMEKSNNKQKVLVNTNSCPNPKLDSRIDSDTVDAKHLTEPSKSSASSSNDPGDNQLDLKSVTIKLEPVTSDSEQVLESSEDTVLKTSKRKSDSLGKESKKKGTTSTPVAAKTPKKGLPLKAVKSEPISPKKQPLTPASQKPRKKNYCPEAVALPFTMGWVRELVHRASEVSKSGKRMSDVYYYTPDGTKLRSMPDISNYLSKKKDFSLSMQNFTFTKDLIYREPFEIERSAKQKSSLSSPAVSAAKKSVPSSTPKPSTSSISSPTSKKLLKISPKRKKIESATSSTRKITSYLSPEIKNNSSASKESTLNSSSNICPSSKKRKSAAKQIDVDNSSAIDATESNQKEISEDDSKSRPSRRISKKIPFDNSINEKNPARRKRLSVDAEHNSSSEKTPVRKRKLSAEGKNNTDSLDSSLKTASTASTSKKKPKTLIVKLPAFKKISKDNNLTGNPSSKRNDRFSSTPKRSKTDTVNERELYLIPRCSIFCESEEKLLPTIQCSLCLCYFHESCVDPVCKNAFTCNLCIYVQSTRSTIESFPFCELPQILDTVSTIDKHLFYPEIYLGVRVSASNFPVKTQESEPAVKTVSSVDKRTTLLQQRAPVLNSLLALPSPVQPSPIQILPELFVDPNNRTVYKKIIVHNGGVTCPNSNNLQSAVNVPTGYQVRFPVLPVGQIPRQNLLPRPLNSKYIRQVAVSSVPKSFAQFAVRLNPLVPGSVNSQHISASPATAQVPIHPVPSSVSQLPVRLKTYSLRNWNGQNVPVSATAQIPILPKPCSVTQLPTCLNNCASGDLNSQSVTVSSSTTSNSQLLKLVNSNFPKNIGTPGISPTLSINNPAVSENTTSVPNSTTKIGSDLYDSDVVKSSVTNSLITYSSSCNVNRNRKHILEDMASNEERPKKAVIEKNAANPKLSLGAGCSDNITIPDTAANAPHTSANSKSKENDCDKQVSRSEHFRFSYDMFCTAYMHFYEVLKRLSLADLLRVKQVSRAWNNFASNSFLYKTMNFNGLEVKDWERCCRVIQQHSAKSVNFSGIVHNTKEKPWENFKRHLSYLFFVEEMIFDYISPQDIYKIADQLNQLQKLECHFITKIYTEPEMYTSFCELKLSFLRLMGRLEWLWLGSPGGIVLVKSSHSILPYLPKLKHLTLTGFQFSSHLNLESLSKLQELTTLELGSCNNIEPMIYDLICVLTNLKRLRLENGGSLNDVKLSKAIRNMSSLEELELMNYKVPIDLPATLEELQNLKHFSIWPDTSSEGPQVNAVSFDAVCKCRRLKSICWGVINEENTDTVPEVLEIQVTKVPLVIKELTFEDLFRQLVETFPGKKVQVQCVPRNLWGEFCCKRE